MRREATRVWPGRLTRVRSSQPTVVQQRPNQLAQPPAVRRRRILNYQDGKFTTGTLQRHVPGRAMIERACGSRFNAGSVMTQSVDCVIGGPRVDRNHFSSERRVLFSYRNEQPP
jgi:hypothetical protein